jgi:hypothetical protein
MPRGAAAGAVLDALKADYASRGVNLVQAGGLTANETRSDLHRRALFILGGTTAAPTSPAATSGVRRANNVEDVEMGRVRASQRA